MTPYLHRKQKKLSAEQVAKELGISRAHYTHLENGTRAFTSRLITKLADVLELPVETVKCEAEELRRNNLMPNSWITGIKVDGKPCIKAFIEYMKTNRSSDNDLRENLVKFIFFHIEHSFRKELDENPEILSFISRKLTF